MKIVFLIMLCGGLAQAKVGSSSTGLASHRTGNKIGVTSGIGNPFPAIFGMNVNYNINDLFRATAGMGEVSVSSGDSAASVKTMGAGIDVLVPGWSLSPLAGLHASKVDVSSTGGAELEIQGIKESTTLTYLLVGLDWQAKGGFNVGLGQVIGLAGGNASGSSLNFGWFF